MKVTKHESDASFQKSNWHEKKLNKEKEKVLLDLIDELIAELDVTYTDANITTKNVKVQESNCSEKSLLIENFVSMSFCLRVLLKCMQIFLLLHNGFQYNEDTQYF